MSLDIGIDIGTAHIYVYGKDEGIVLKEPAVIAIDTVNKEVKAVGNEAYALIGRNTGNIITSYIYENKNYLNKDIMLEVLKYIVGKTIGKIKLIRPRMCISVHTFEAEECKDIIKECAFDAGARDAVVIESPIAATIGSRVDTRNTSGNIIVDIGERTSAISVISHGKILKNERLDISGLAFDEVIAEHIRKTYGVIIGRKYAEDIKLEYADLNSFAENMLITVKGRSTDDGLLCELPITSYEIRDEFIKVVDKVACKIKKFADDIDEEIKDDILSRGIILTGASALIPGLERLMEEKTGITTMVPDNADKARVTGTGIVLECTGGNEL